MIFTQNNLESSSSPYLRQHKDNPIWWQEWSKETLDYAKVNKKIIFASVGYATCHWCHVMAGEAFSDLEVAEYLNKYFVSIKVDREQRPDIDQYLMNFIFAITGQGGWPLNVFLAPDLRPIYALTYLGVISNYGIPSFRDVIKKIKEFFDREGEKIGQFNIATYEPTNVLEDEIIEKLISGYDKVYSGFGMDNKFPPHSALIFMLYYYAATKNQQLESMIKQTLDRMLIGGLHDHLQGGFFRYCVDRNWTIPHFEKMLYDQAMLLWIYAVSFKLFGQNEYKIAVENILKCLEDTFQEDGLFYSGHDADTNHQEGATYLWSDSELKDVLSKEEYNKFIQVYDISVRGNFEGKNHLIKKTNVFLEDIEERLLTTRRKRPQPFVDKKIIASWNCLVGISLIHAHRYLDRKEYLEKAENLFKKLMSLLYIDGRLYHSYFDGKIDKKEFLCDYASMLLFLTYLQEETENYDVPLNDFYNKIQNFKKNDSWIESANDDFIEIKAQEFDQPIPSSVSLAELAILRTDILNNRNYNNAEFREPLAYDFFNISVMLRNGLFHLVKTPKRLAWENLPINTLQIKGKKLQDCYNGICRLNVIDDR